MRLLLLAQLYSFSCHSISDEEKKRLITLKPSCRSFVVVVLGVVVAVVAVVAAVAVVAVVAVAAVVWAVAAVARLACCYHRFLVDQACCCTFQAGPLVHSPVVLESLHRCHRIGSCPVVNLIFFSSKLCYNTIS
jgi:hypothetical protein